MEIDDKGNWQAARICYVRLVDIFHTTQFMPRIYVIKVFIALDFVYGKYNF